MARTGVGTGRTAAALGALLLVTACGSGGATPSEPAAEASFDTAAPEGEATGATEGAGDAGADVAVELPGLPIGGSSTVVSEALQCVDVGWSEPPVLPGWLGITVTGVGFSPADGFAVSSETCPGAPSCLDPGFRLTVAGPRCVVAVTWTSPATAEEASMFFTSGVLACPSEQVGECEAFRDAVATEGAQGIALQPAPAADGTTPVTPSGDESG